LSLRKSRSSCAALAVLIANNGYEIVDDPLGAQNAAPTADEDGDVCLHTEIEPYEDEPTRGACVL